MIIGCTKYHEYRGLYLTQVSWNLWHVCQYMGKHLRHTASIFAEDLDTAKAVIDKKYDRIAFTVRAVNE